MSFFDSASLVQIPSGVKDGVLYSVKPTDGSGDLTFSRGSDIEATRVNANGYIEKAKVNLLLQSGDFSNVAWSVTRNQITADATTAPDGTTTADKTEANSTFVANSSRVYQAVSISGVNTVSVYAKAGEITEMLLYAIGANDGIYFNLSTGSFVAYYNNLNIISYDIVSAGSGWYRYSITFDTAISRFEVYLSKSGNYVADYTLGEGFYIWHPQVNYGLVAQEYQETTTAAVVTGITNDMPRLNYDPANPTCPSLLLEPSRTNLIPHSEFFGAWTLGGTTTIDFGYPAPDGTNSAYKVTNVSGGSISYSGVTDQNYSRTIYARTTSGTGTAQLCSYFGNTNNTFTITEEWQRFEVNTTTTATGATNFYGVDFRGGGTLSEIILWGAQSENATYATSYIPTYGTSATRTADACSKTGISSLIGQTEGTLFADIVFNNIHPSDGGLMMRIAQASGSFSNAHYIDIDATGLVRGLTYNGGVQQSSIVSGTHTKGTRLKVAYAYKANDFALYINGVQIGTDTSGSVPSSLEFLMLGCYAPTKIAQVPMDSALLFSTRLSNADLATLTSL